MRLIITADYDELSREAAAAVARCIRERPDCVLGLAAGATPVGTYRELVRRYRRGQVDFDQVRTFNLDEYYPIEPGHPRSFRQFMWDHLFSQVNVRRDNVHLPRGDAADPAEECGRYEAAIEDAGGLDLLLLGIGANGHIGFNEPGTPLASTTHLVCLTDETVAANARLFNRPEDVPRLAITMGPKTIMRARRLLLLAGGEAKATALAAALEGPVTPGVPASILQLHACATGIADRAAASRLQGDPGRGETGQGQRRG